MIKDVNILQYIGYYCRIHYANKSGITELCPSLMEGVSLADEK